MFFILREKSKINPIEIMEPINAAIISVHDETFIVSFKNHIIVKATTIFAPEDIPSTNGPAIGFSKNVCKRKPDRDKAPPSNAAIIIRGSLIFQIILYSLKLPSLRNMILNISLIEILTFPVFIFKTAIAKSAAASMTNTSTKRLRLFISLLNDIFFIITSFLTDFTYQSAPDGTLLIKLRLSLSPVSIACTSVIKSVILSVA